MEGFFHENSRLREQLTYDTENQQNFDGLSAR